MVQVIINNIRLDMDLAFLRDGDGKFSYWLPTAEIAWD